MSGHSFPSIATSWEILNPSIINIHHTVMTIRQCSVNIKNWKFYAPMTLYPSLHPTAKTSRNIRSFFTSADAHFHPASENLKTPLIRGYSFTPENRVLSFQLHFDPNPLWVLHAFPSTLSVFLISTRFFFIVFS